MLNERLKKLNKDKGIPKTDVYGTIERFPKWKGFVGRVHSACAIFSLSSVALPCAKDARSEAEGEAAFHRELGRKVGAEALKQELTPEQLLEEIKETRKTLFSEHYAELA